MEGSAPAISNHGHRPSRLGSPVVPVGHSLAISPPAKPCSTAIFSLHGSALPVPLNAVATSESLLVHLLLSFLSSIVSIGLTASSLSRLDFITGPLYIYYCALLIANRKDPSSRQPTLGCSLQNPWHQQRPTSPCPETSLGRSIAGDAGEESLN